MGRFASGRGPGRGRGRSSNNKKNQNENDKKEYKFYPLGTGKSKATYDQIKDKIENDIQQTFGKGARKVVESLRDMKEYDWDKEKPELDVSEAKNDDEKARENRQYELEYIEDVKEHKKKKEQYEADMEKAYARIWDRYTSEAMKSRIMNLSDFEKDVRDKPVELLTRIREVSLMPKKSRYHYDSMTEAMLTFLLCKQKEHEGLRDYYSRWKQARDNIKEHIGDGWIRHFVRQTKSYKEETDKKVMNELEDDAFKHWTAYMLIRNSSDEKYGSLKQELRGRYGGKFDEYPRSPEAAYDRLLEHKWDNTKDKNKKNKNKDVENTDTENKHVNMHQKDKSTSERVCWVCGASDHMKPNCPILKKDKNYPKDKWFINQAFDTQKKYNQYQEKQKAEEENTIDEDAMSAISAVTSLRHNDKDIWMSDKKSTAKKGQSGLQLGIMMNNTTGNDHNRPKKWMNEFILDSGTTFSMLANKDLASEVFPAKEKIEMHTNAGCKLLEQQAHVPGFGKMYLNEEGLANIFGLDDLVQKGYRVTFDSDVANRFMVYGPDKTLKGVFDRTKEGLYAMKDNNGTDVGNMSGDEDEPLKDMSNNIITTCRNVVTTEKQAKKLYTPEQERRAVRARRLFDAVGPMTTENFKAVLRTNIIQDNPVVHEDCDIADAILNPKSKSYIQGKWIRQQPKQVVHTRVEIPAELIIKYRDMVLCMDTMHVSSEAFLATIDKTVKFRGCVALGGQTDEAHYKALDKILRIYNAAGFRIKTIECDGLYKGMMDKVADTLEITMNYCNPDEHVPPIERGIRVIKERCRVHYHRMPYKVIPKVMIRVLGEQCCKMLNIIPAKGGVSKYYSPHMIMKRTNLNYNKDFKHMIGDYGMANAPTDNTMKARAVEVIYLRPVENAQGGHECMHLNTGKKIVSTRFQPLLITDTVIKQVERLATAQGILSFKITTKNGNVLFDSAQIAGVDYGNAPQNQNEDETVSEYELHDEEFEEIEETYESSDEESEYSVATNQEANSEQNNNKDEHENDDASEGSIETADGQESEEQDVAVNEPRRSTRTTTEIERLEPKWGGKVYHQTKIEHENMNKQIRRVNKEVEKMNYSREEAARELEYNHNILWQLTTENERDRTIEYSYQQGVVLARMINDFQERVTISGYSYAQQYLLSKGLKLFGDRGKEASKKELDQLCRRNCFTPISISDMTVEERRRAQVALMFLTEKRSKEVKGRMVFNGKPTREWLSREESASPTAATESVMLTSFIDAHEERDVMTVDIPNAFIQAELPMGKENSSKHGNKQKDDNERVMMKITGVLVDMLVQLNPNLYSKHVVLHNGKKTVYVWVLRALYGMLTSSLLWYKKFRKDLESYGFDFNPYDPCVASRMVKGHQHTIRFHVDDIMSSHRDKNVNTKFGLWLNEKYGKHKEVVPVRGKLHDFLGMNFDFTEAKVLSVDMCGHVDNMIDSFPIKFGKEDTSKYPADKDLFDEGTEELLNDEEKEQFHTTTAKGLYVSKRARPDIQLAIAVLCTRVQNPRRNDWNKLVKLLRFLNGTRGKKLKITANNLAVIKWYVDASFAVHPDYKSHTGATMIFDGGLGSIMNLSRKQKLNTRSSTEAELVGVDDASVLILWTKLFLEYLGYHISNNIIYQDNKSAILLETNGRQSAGKRSRALNIRYFFITDQVEKGNAAVEYCNTDDMIGDFHTKPVQGHKYKKFGDTIMGITMFHIWNIVGSKGIMSW